MLLSFWYGMTPDEFYDVGEHHISDSTFSLVTFRDHPLEGWFATLDILGMIADVYPIFESDSADEYRLTSISVKFIGVERKEIESLYNIYTYKYGQPRGEIGLGHRPECPIPEGVSEIDWISDMMEGGPKYGCHTPIRKEIEVAGPVVWSDETVKVTFTYDGRRSALDGHYAQILGAQAVYTTHKHEAEEEARQEARRQEMEAVKEALEAEEETDRERSQRRALENL